MTQHPSRKAVPAARRLADSAFSRIEQFLHIEALSGVVLLSAALIALIWANSPYAQSYEHLWHMPVSIGIGAWQLPYSLHFWINDALMAVFFLVVGMEIRREVHDGSLARVSQVALPMAAAIGGVAVPALLYVSLNMQAPAIEGWAVPTATDIAFAVGVLALLGRSIAPSVRIFLLTLAIIDDIIAVLIIALFYSGGLAAEGFVIAAAGVLLVLAMQFIGISRAWLYVLPGAVLWFGLLKTGAHPTLAGVILGLMTPVQVMRPERSPKTLLSQALARLQDNPSVDVLALSARHLREAQRELLAPAARVQMALHPWVAYVVMPVFALANAGIAFDAIDLNHAPAQGVLLGVTLALVLGKPLGVLAASWLAIRLGCRMPEGMNWLWLVLVGVLAGIGFTMSIFIANLAFTSAELLAAAKLGVLLASAAAALLGIGLGMYLRQISGQHK